MPGYGGGYLRHLAAGKSLVGLPQSPRGATGFSTARGLIEAGAVDVTFLVISDSTGNANDEVIYRFAAWLGTQYPTHTVEFHYWNDGTPAYDAAITIQTGSGARKIIFRNAAVTGASTNYLLGAKYAAAIEAVTPNVVIWNHGHNVDVTNAEITRGSFFQGIEAVKFTHPNAATIFCLQNPRRDDTGSDVQIAALRRIAAEYGDTVLDFWSRWIAAGKPSGWYGDAIHPNSTGHGENLFVAQEEWRKSYASPVLARPGWWKTRAVNLVNLDAAGVDQGYGRFAGYVSGTPTGWSLSGTPTISKELTIVDTAMGDTFSIKIEAATALHGIRRDLSAAALAIAKAAGTVTMAVRKYVPADQVDTVGRIGLQQSGTGEVDRTSPPNTYAKGRWVWEILSGQLAASTITFLTPNLYCNSAAGASVAYYGLRAAVYAGALPFDDQTAASPP